MIQSGHSERIKETATNPPQANLRFNRLGKSKKSKSRILVTILKDSQS